MKKNKIIFPLIGFFSGLLMSAAFLGILSFTSAPSMPAVSGVVTITATQAASYVGTYLKDAGPSNYIIKGFTIDMQQFEAMSRLARENPSLSGFRVYLGKDAKANGIGIVVGVDLTGKDAVSGSVYGTDAKTLSPCPPICDNSSSIVAQ